MWPNPQETANLVTFTEEIHTGKINFLCSEIWIKMGEQYTSFTKSSVTFSGYLF